MAAPEFHFPARENLFEGVAKYRSVSESEIIGRPAKIARFALHE
ncbi:hypothetical protein [Roseomonas gilardii]|nr:hypothetical protein [Roseomonas gilardii]